MGTSQRKAKDLIWKTLSGISVFGFAFVVSYLSSSHFAPVSESQAASGTGASTSTYYADISSSGSIDITLQSTPDGVYKVGKDSLSIDTNSTLGYKLYISTEDKSSISDSSIPSNGLIDSATGAYISPSSGTVDTPVRLGTNTWGYTVSRSNNTETSTVYVDSDAAPTEAKGGLAVWRAVPEYGDEDIFYTNSSPATASTNSVDVYYAVNASTALPSGTYSNTVVYTAITEGTAPSSTSSLTVTPSSQNGITDLASKSVTISTGLYSSLAAENIGTATVTIGGGACTSPVNSIGTDSNLEITCDTPAQSDLGSYDVTVTITKNGQTIYSETLPGGYTYNKPTYGFSTCAATTTGGTFTQDGIVYIKLADGNCWTKESQGIMNWETAVALNSEGTYNICPTGTHIPSAQEYANMVIAYDGTVYDAGGVNVPYGYSAPNTKLKNNLVNWWDDTSLTNYNLWSSTETATAGSGRYVWHLALATSVVSTGYSAVKADSFGAVCVGSTVPEFYAITDMQQMTHSICASVPAPIGPTESGTNFTNVITRSNWTPTSAGTPQTTLVDTRSGTAKTSYTIRKFPDGKCWMARNLRYAPTAATTLSSGSSDILSSNTWQMPKLGTYNSGYADYNGDEVYEGSYGAKYDATYYSWHTATAGTGTSSMTSGNTTQSICPKNWRLPTGGNGVGTTDITVAGSATNLENGDFQQLDIKFGGTGENDQAGGRANWVNNTYGFNASLLGAFEGSAARHGDSFGSWWSSSVYRGDGAYRLQLSTSVLYPLDATGKGVSYALRCVAR